jgi:hypothetical protein
MLLLLLVVRAWAVSSCTRAHRRGSVRLQCPQPSLESLDPPDEVAELQRAPAGAASAGTAPAARQVRPCW